MKQYAKGVAAQATAILLAALGAALFTFFQSVADSTAICPVVEASPEQAGLLGALLKGAHTAYQGKKALIL